MINPYKVLSNGTNKNKNKNKKINTKNSSLRHVSTKPSAQRHLDQLLPRSTLKENPIQSRRDEGWSKSGYIFTLVHISPCSSVYKPLLLPPIFKNVFRSILIYSDKKF